MSTSALVRLACSGLVLLVLCLWFVRLERRGERHTIFVVLVLSFLVEAVLGGHSSNTSVGLLRPKILGQDFRLEDAVIVAVLIARLLGRAGRGFIPSGILPTAAFGVWYLGGVVLGTVNGIEQSQVLFQGKTLFYVLGGMVAAAGADPDRLVRQLRTPAKVLAVVVVAGAVLGAARRKFSISLPVQSFTELGVISNDTATVLLLIGGFVLLAEAVRSKRRPGMVVAGLALLASPVAGDHRATYLVLIWLLTALTVTLATRTWRRRCTLSPMAVGAAGLVVVAVVLGAFVLAGSPGVLGSRFDVAFRGDATAQSAESRVALMRRAFRLAEERPLTGWGVGMQVVRTGVNLREEDQAAAHNLVADLCLRSGVIGLGLFVVAMARNVQIGLRRWRREQSDAVAAVCLAATIGFLGVIVKAMVEPALDKYRLSLFFGLCLGLVLVAGRSRPPLRPAPPRMPMANRAGRDLAGAPQ